MITVKNILCFQAALLSTTSVVAQKSNVNTKPNIVLIIADQWRGDALGCLNKEPVITPNLDKLANSGVNFTQAVSSYPVSSPARGMLMTGMYPHKSGVAGNCNSDNTPFNNELRADSKCWSDVLDDAGYNLAYIGKWHLDAPRKPYVKTGNNMGKIAWNEWTPKDRRHGFKTWIAYGTYDNHLKPMYWQTDDQRDDWKFINQWGPEYEADRAIEYIEQIKEVNSDKPFAMVVSFNPPHTGYDLVPNKYKKLYKNLNVDSLARVRPELVNSSVNNIKYFKNSVADYYACMTGVDEQIGRIVASLKENNLINNTIIIFTSDHGDSMGMHSNIGKNIYYDEAMRVPIIINYANVVAPRVDNSTLIAFADLGPTILGLSKLPIPKEMQTHDFSKSILNNKIDTKVDFQPYFRLNPNDLSTGIRGIRDHRYTYAIGQKYTGTDQNLTSPSEIEEYLFDRQNDPFENKNIAKEEQALTNKYRKLLYKYLKSIEDPFAEKMK